VKVYRISVRMVSEVPAVRAGGDREVAAIVDTVDCVCAMLWKLTRRGAA